MANETVLVLDFGGQYNQLIARRVREAGVYSVVKPHTTPLEEIRAAGYKGILFTGGPSSVYEDGALKYEIVRIKIADDAQSVQLPVPNPASSYLASLDNMGGVVMAYTY